VATVVQSTLQLDPTLMGLLMSCFGLTGLLLGVPAGVVVGRSSLKKLTLVGLAALVAGNFVPLLRFTAGVITAGRVVGGVGFALVAVAAPAIVSASAPPGRRGLAMGIWSAWVPAGTILVFNLAPSLLEAFSLAGVWGFCLLLSLAALGAVWLLVPNRPAAENNPTPASSPGGESLPDESRRLNPRLLCITGIFALYASTMLSVTTWFPTFLVQVRSMPLATATFIGSLASVGAVGGCLVAGHLYDRYRSLRRICITSCVIQALLYLLIFNLTGVVVPVAQTLVGFIGSMVPTAVFAAVSHLARRRREVALGLGLTLTAQNGGLILGPSLTGLLLGTTGSWDLLAMTISLTCALTAVLWLVLPVE